MQNANYVLQASGDKKSDPVQYNEHVESVF